MSLCPVCGRAYCDHTPEQRDQTYEEVMAPLTDAEKELFESEPSDSSKKIALGKEVRKKQKEARSLDINKSYA